MCCCRLFLRFSFRRRRSRRAPLEALSLRSQSSKLTHVRNGSADLLRRSIGFPDVTRATCLRGNAALHSPLRAPLDCDFLMVREQHAYAATLRCTAHCERRLMASSLW
jgi:hypothetical protein